MKKNKTYHEKYNWFYQSKSWRDLRNRKWADADGLCEICRKDGKVKAAREIHHIVPIEEDLSKALQYNNLLALCSKHHNEMHSRISNMKKFLNEFEKI